MGDWVLAICTAIGAVVYLNADSKLPQLQVGDPMGPQVFPALIGIGLLGSALLLMAETWRKRRLAGTTPPPDPTARAHLVILVGMVLWTALYYFAFEPLACFNRGRWWVNAACAVGFTLVAYGVFTRFLQVALPQGVLDGVFGT